MACGFFLGNFMRIDMDCGSLSAARLKEHFGLPDYTPLERDDGRNNFEIVENVAKKALI